MARAAKKAAAPPVAVPDRGSLLAEPLFGVADIRGRRIALTLPQVFARLSDPASSTIAFTALQAHQSHAWHAFLVQVAAMALHRAGETTPWTSAERWQKALVSLAGGRMNAWTLVVGDLSQPAFLQPPVPEGTLNTYGSHLQSPGALDLLFTARNHDCKSKTGAEENLAAWAIALVSLQTQQGYSGSKNYGIFRMNGGFGNRPGIGVRKGLDVATAFRRDLAVLLDAREAVLRRGLFLDDGIALLWCIPWDGMASIPWNTLDPWTVECCRRVRLLPTSSAFIAVMAPTTVARVAVPDNYTGNAGDPWTPVGRTGRNAGKGLTLPSTGFTYARVVDLLLSQDWEAPPAQGIRADDHGDLRWLGQTLVRGQGKTEGWHEREVPIPECLRSRFASPEGRDTLAQTAQHMVRLAAVMRLKILQPTLRALWDSENNRKRKDPSGTADAMIGQGLSDLEARIDATFFDHLWDHPEDPDPWRERLATFARHILEDHSHRVNPSADRWRRIAKAEATFGYRMHNWPDKEYGIFLPLATKNDRSHA